MHVHRARVTGIIVVFPHGFQHLLAGERAAAVGDEHLQEIKFLRGQAHFLSAEGDGALDEVDLHIMHADDFLLLHDVSPGAAQHGANPRAHLQNVERFGHVVVRAVFQTEDFVHVLALGGQHDNRNTGCFADALADAESVHLWQHHVQQHKIIHPGKEFVQRFLTIHGGIGFVAVLFKRIFQAFQNKRLIVHQQNAFSHDGSPQYNLPRTAACLLYPEL